MIELFENSMAFGLKFHAWGGIHVYRYEFGTWIQMGFVSVFLPLVWEEK